MKKKVKKTIPNKFNLAEDLTIKELIALKKDFYKSILILEKEDGIKIKLIGFNRKLFKEAKLELNSKTLPKFWPL